jgi:ELWxxDGT repeat protein
LPVRDASGTLNAFGSLTPFRGLLFFAGADAAHGVELWRTDGTVEGTRIVRDIAPGPRDSGVSSLTVVEDLLVFGASDGDHGMEPWKSDGTEAGTVMIQDLIPGPSSSTPHSFQRSGPLVYFVADDGATGSELWAIPVSSLRAAGRQRSPRPLPPR